MTESTTGAKRRTWQLLTIVGFVATVCLSIISYMDVPAEAVLKAGHSLPALPVSTAVGMESSLDIEAIGFKEILVITPSCDRCTSHLVDLVTGVGSEPAGSGQWVNEVMFLVIRSDLMPRSDFMPALERAQALGAQVVMISSEEGRKLGIFEFPVVIKLTEEGEVASIILLSG